MSATMTNHSRRQIQPPVSVSVPVPSNKRKERDGIHGVKPSAVTTKSLAKPSIRHRAPPATPAPVRSPHPPTNNHMLAGYLAHEFLNNGTFFGEPWEPARPEPVPVSATSTRLKPSGDKRKAETSGIAEKQQRYVEVAHLLKEDGTYLPGIVNPKQLAQFLHLE